MIERDPFNLSVQCGTTIRLITGKATTDLGTRRNSTYWEIPSFQITHSCWRQYPFTLERCPMHTNIWYQSIIPARCQLCDYLKYEINHVNETTYSRNINNIPSREVGCQSLSREPGEGMAQRQVWQEIYADDNLQSSTWRFPVPNPHIQEEQAKRNQVSDKSVWMRWRWRTTQTQSQNNLKTKYTWLTTEEEKVCIPWR